MRLDITYGKWLNLKYHDNNNDNNDNSSNIDINVCITQIAL